MGTLTSIFPFVLLITYSHQSASACSLNQNGTFSIGLCRQEYLTCAYGTRQRSTCEEGHVFFGEHCIPREHSPECVSASSSTRPPSDEPSFDCSGHSDGEYSVGCRESFYKCVSNLAYRMFCPQGLVYVASERACLESCDSKLVRHVSSTYQPQTFQKDDVANSDAQFDCTGLPDGIHASGCSRFYFHCANEHSFLMYCPDELLYNPTQGMCDYSCEAPSNSPSETPVPSPYKPSAQTASDEAKWAPYPAGNVPAASDAVATTEATTTAHSWAAVYTTPWLAPATSTWAPAGNDQPFPATTRAVFVEIPTTTTRMPIVSPSAPAMVFKPQPICTNGNISSIGQCSSKFLRCRENILEGVQCPSSTLFDTDLLICVYDMPSCQLASLPLQPLSPIISEPALEEPQILPTTTDDIVMSPFAEDVRVPNNYNRPAQYPSRSNYGAQLENPFFVPHRVNRHKYQHRGHAQVSLDSPFAPSRGAPIKVDNAFSDRSARQGQLRYRKSRVTNGRFVVVDDRFNGYAQNGFTSNIGDVYPLGYRERSYYNNRPMSSLSSDALSKLNPTETPVLHEPVEVTSVATLNEMKTSLAPELLSKLAAQKENDEDDETTTEENEGSAESEEEPETQKDEEQEREEVEGESVDGDENYDDNENKEDLAKRRRRSIDYTMDRRFAMSQPSFSPTVNFCSEVSSGVTKLVSMGMCRQDFFYCGATGIRKKAACPIGELFDGLNSVCVNAHLCGVNTLPVTTITQDVPLGSPWQRPTALEATTKAPEGFAHKHEICANVLDGPMSVEKCSSVYVQCNNGFATAQKCPAGLTFDNSRALCDFSHKIADCNVAADVPVVTTAPVVTNVIAEPVAVPLQMNPCAVLTDGIHADHCSKTYLDCLGGQLTMTVACPKGYVFNTQTSSCFPFTDMPDCSPRQITRVPVVQQDSMHTTQSSWKPLTSQIFVDTTTTTTQAPPSEIHVLPQNDDESAACKVGFRAALGFCYRTYLECNQKNEFVQVDCAAGKVYDNQWQRCIEPTSCGVRATKPVEASTTARPVVVVGQDRPVSSNGNPICLDAAEGSTHAVDTCRSSYIRCSSGNSFTEYCLSTEVFSNFHKQCVNRESVPECRVSPPKSPSYKPPTSFVSNDDVFCSRKTDGLYRNPGDCTAILQCFGGESFEYPSCPSMLAFNEETGKCDYRHNVAGCNVDDDVDGCSQHGVSIVDENDCSIFYRCVAGHKVQMSCPKGTLFNTVLSVCDWPANVSCSSSSAR